MSMKAGGFGAAVLSLVLGVAGLVSAADPVGVLTEIRAERGRVEVRRAGESEWKPAQPLLALRPGDQIRATDEARAALVFTGGRGAQAVSAANSPFTVQAGAAAGAGDKVRGLVGGVTDFLAGKQKDLAYLPLSVRGVRPPRDGAARASRDQAPARRRHLRMVRVRHAPLQDPRPGPAGHALGAGRPPAQAGRVSGVGAGARGRHAVLLAARDRRTADAAGGVPDLAARPRPQRVRESLDILVPASLPGYPLPASRSCARATSCATGSLLTRGASS